MPPTARAVTAVIAAAEGLTLLGYAGSITWVAVTSGLQGPVEVSSPAGVTVEVLVFALFGAGVLALAVGRWRGTGWSTVPFVVVQLLALTVGIPLVTGTGGALSAGVVITAAAVIGLGGVVMDRINAEPGQPSQP